VLSDPKDPYGPPDEGVADDEDEHWSAWDEWGDEHPKEYARPKARARLKAKDEDAAVPEAPPREGLVVRVGSKHCDVWPADAPGEQVRCVFAGELAANQRAEVAVGDQVVFRARPQGAPVVEEVRPRRSELSRPDPLNPRIRRVLAANVDLVVVVVSLVAPPLKPGLVDRVLLAIEQGGAEALVFVNKRDLLDDADAETRASEADALVKVRVHEDHGTAVLEGSAATGEGLEALRGALREKTVAFVGHSGVGKSSVMNTLHPELALEVGEVRERDGLGRHTTTQASVHRLPDGVRLIDTPGVRQFGLWEMEPRELALLFPEFRELAPRCRFADCTHVHEPGCAVRAAIDAGEVPEHRVRVYRELLAAVEEAASEHWE
jgi:ribosome biogenesis GTPase